nr:hypothetical protein [Tanacetum cinerariifolium]
MMHAPVEWKLYDSCGVHHVTSQDNEIFMLIEKDYPLRKGLAIVMISYKLQVENYSQMANDLILKIYKIANLEWKLYDTCGVHYVTSKDKEIFMLVEKDYPLRKGLAIRKISYKLQVENYSKMENDLILKIYKIASSPRQQDD